MSTPEKALDKVDQPESPADAGDRAALINAAELFGATRLANELANRFAAQTMRMLQVIRDEKAWREYGFQSFDDMLDNHPNSPLTKHQFYEREKALGLEGDAAFNALNAVRAPISKRKLLKAGDVIVDGDFMTIGEQRFDIKDEDSIILAISALAMDRDKDKRTIERGKKELETKKRRIDELEEKMSHAGGINLDGTAHARALVGALGELALLNQEIAKIEDPEARKHFGDLALERIAAAKLELEETLGYAAPDQHVFAEGQ